MHARRATAAVVFAIASSFAHAQVSDDKVKIGFITDMSGVYADLDGPGGLEAIRMAVADFGGKVLGKPIEIVSADHQNKADVAASKAREWIDRDGVDVLFAGPNSAAGLAMNRIAAEKKRVYINLGGGTPRLTNEECTPYTVHYAYDTNAHVRGTIGALRKQGVNAWYLLSVDYAFGKDMDAESRRVIAAGGGKVVGGTKHPLGAPDFSSYLLQAQSSGAQAVALANAGGDTINAIKAAKDFGLDKKMRVVGLVMTIDEIHALGLQTAQGMQLIDPWYWNSSDAARKFGERFYAKFKKMPSALQAADYSATLTYLKAVQAAGTDDSDRVMAKLKSMKIDDMYTQGGYVRADGMMIHDIYLFEVKKPAESTRPWDYYKLAQTIPGEQAFNTLAESACPMVKK